MLILVAMHLFFNYRAVKSLKLRTLNEERLWIILNEFFKTNKVCLIF